MDVSGKMLLNLTLCSPHQYVTTLIALIILCSQVYCYESSHDLHDTSLQTNNHTTDSGGDAVPVMDSPPGVIPNSKSNIPASNIESSCRAFIVKFSDMAAKFTKCSIENARPLRFCEHCMNDYLQAKEVYSGIMKGLTQDGPNIPCGRMVLNSDKVEIIGQTANFIDKIWSDCNCKNCFDSERDGNITVLKISNDSQQFQKLANLTWSCFVNNSRIPKHIYGFGKQQWRRQCLEMPTISESTEIIPFYPKNFTTNASVCADCRQFYEDTNQFYITLEMKFSSKVCMDLVDSMNYTRILWSDTFKCSRPQEDVVGVLILSGLFCSTPVIFYITSKIYGSRMEHRILEQKRLKRGEAASTSNSQSTSQS